jgi:hypothetical protein
LDTLKFGVGTMAFSSSLFLPFVVFDVLFDFHFNFAFVRYPGLVHRPIIISVAYVPLPPDDHSLFQFVDLSWTRSNLDALERDVGHFCFLETTLLQAYNSPGFHGRNPPVGCLPTRVCNKIYTLTCRT